MYHLPEPARRLSAKVSFSHNKTEYFRLQLSKCLSVLLSLWSRLTSLARQDKLFMANHFTFNIGHKTFYLSQPQLILSS